LENAPKLAIEGASENENEKKDDWLNKFGDEN
jgi:hypothetical protein